MPGLSLSLTDRAGRLSAGHAGPPPTPPPPPRPTVIVIEGDSITASANPDSYARLWAAEHNTLDIRNLAVGGSQLPDLQARAGAVAAANPTHLSVMIGANDLPSDTAAYLAQLWVYTDPFRSAGARVVVGTVLPRSGVTDWSTKRGNFNAALRAAVGVKIDAIFDFDTSPMGATGAEGDAASYPDGLHPSNAGHSRLKRVYAPVMNGMLGIANEPLDFAFAPQGGAAADSDHDSPAYTVSGLWLVETRPYAVSPGGRVAKNGGGFVLDGSGTVANGDTLRLRNRSAATPATQTDVTLTIGTTAATYSVTTAGAGSRDWLPSDLGTKLKLWLRPEAITGAQGAQMVAWPDASGNAVAVTGAGASSRPTVVANGLNGFATVRFDAPLQSRFTLPGGHLTGRTGMASFAVSRIVADPPSAHFGPPFAGWGSEGSGEFFPYINGSIYSSYGSSVRHQTPDPTPSLTDWRLVSFHAAANDWRCYIDGTTLLSVGSSPFATGAAPVIGFDAGGGAFDGQIAEIVDCASVLTTAERQRVEGYLAWKYGLAGNLPSGHPYRDAKPTI